MHLIHQPFSHWKEQCLEDPFLKLVAFLITSEHFLAENFRIYLMPRLNNIECGPFSVGGLEVVWLVININIY